jgi:hypothetical protein
MKPPKLLLPLTALALLIPTSAGARTRALLPDLAQGDPTNVSLVVDASGPQPRMRLAFDATVANVGTGPLILTGRRGPSTPAMTARQVVRRSDGSSYTRSRRAGVLRFSTDLHRHWHLQDFDRFELWNAQATRRLLRRSEGFCVADTFSPFASRPIRFQPRVPAFANHCAVGRPELLSITMGISVGWGDGATPRTSDLDVTRIATGSYLLVHRVNPARRLLETNPFNNVACTPVRLNKPSRPQASPTVTVLRRSRLCTTSVTRWGFRGI